MKYKVRVKRHKFNQKLVGFIVKRIALRLIKISNLHTKNDEGEYQGLCIIHYPKVYDTYTSCKSPNKEYCGKKSCQYVAYIAGYSFYGNTLSEMYCNIIGRLLLDAPQFPFCTSKIILPKLQIHYRVYVEDKRMILPTDKHFNTNY